MGLLKAVYYKLKYLYQGYRALFNPGFWYLIQTKQWVWFKPDKGNRFLGYSWTYYDGNHYALGFWWWTLSFNDYKDRHTMSLKWTFLEIAERLRIIR